MKATWESTERHLTLHGLYKRRNWLASKLICYFMNEYEARATARHLGKSFRVKRILHWRRQICP